MNVVGFVGLCWAMELLSFLLMRFDADFECVPSGFFFSSYDALFLDSGRDEGVVVGVCVRLNCVNGKKDACLCVSVGFWCLSFESNALLF